MADVLPWPIIPRPVPVDMRRAPLQSRMAQRERNIVVSEADQKREKDAQLAWVQKQYLQVLRALMICAQANDETAWAIRLVETTLGEAKSEFETGAMNGG